MNPVSRLVHNALLPLRRPFLARRVRRLVLERSAGFDLVVLPDVLNPVVFRTGDALAKALAEVAEARPPSPGARALDMGTGTGIAGLALARSGWRVVSVDVNPEAVRCARVNALLNRLEGSIEAREGDLFEPVRGELFELVVFNPPFFHGAPRDLHDVAWRSLDVWRRFVADLPRFLAPSGVCLSLLSDHGDEAGMRKELEATGLDVSIASTADLGNERLTLYAARRGA